MYRIDMEGDVGQEGLIFASIGASTRWLKANLNVAEMAKANEQSVVEFLLEYKAKGLLSLELLKVIE